MGICRSNGIGVEHDRSLPAHDRVAQKIRQVPAGDGQDKSHRHLGLLQGDAAERHNAATSAPTRAPAKKPNSRLSNSTATQNPIIADKMINAIQ
jgi:hypothetical protein